MRFSGKVKWEDEYFNIYIFFAPRGGMSLSKNRRQVLSAIGDFILEVLRDAGKRSEQG